MVKDREAFGSVQVKLSGFMGDKIRKCVENGVMKTDFSRFIKAFEDKEDSDGLFCGEFWGKWFTSAVLAYECETDEKKKKMYMDEILIPAADGIVNVQEENGRLSCSATDFTVWDLWGRKYVMLGLIACYDVVKDKRYLDAASALLDNLIETLKRTGTRVTETGLKALQALSSCSILVPVAQLAARTKNEKFLAFAKEMIADWSVPSSYNKKGIRLIESVKERKYPVNIASPKGYEAMSCYEGLLEMYRATGDKEYLDTVVSYMERVCEREIMITGSGSCGELWCDGAYRQTQLLEAPMETCVTATYMKMCAQLLRLTGDPVWADRLEISSYNALAGAMKQDGSWWAYFSPLQGQRVYSHIQIEQMQSSCCVLNGPRALLEIPKWAAMETEEGICINFYEKGEYEAKSSGLRLVADTNYPAEGDIAFQVAAGADKEITLAFRIPSWAKGAKVLVNGEEQSCQEGTYLKITREWKEKDTIKLTFPVEPEIVTAPGNPVYRAVKAGPVILALDKKIAFEVTDQKRMEEGCSLWLCNQNMEEIKDEQMNLTYVRMQGTEDEGSAPVCQRIVKEGALTAWKITFLERPLHFFDHRKVELVFCDYASCGKNFAEDDSIRVWFPSPLYTRGLFLENTKQVIAGKGRL